MSQNLEELCCLLIEQFYGEFFSAIYQQLVASGRCTAGHVAQRIRRPVRQVKIGLATMVQLRLIYHHTLNDVTTYQANQETIYDIIRHGKLIALARARYHDLGGRIITHAILMGITTMAELENVTNSHPPEANASATNGHHDQTTNGHHPEPTTLETIQSLLDDGFLFHVRTAQLQSDHDALQDVERAFGSGGSTSTLKGRKAQAEHDLRVEREKKSRQSTRSAERGFVPNTTSKRALDDDADESASKRQKTDSNSAVKKVNGHSSRFELARNKDILIAVTFQNAVSNCRDKYIESITKKVFGKRASKVLACALQYTPLSKTWDPGASTVQLDLPGLCDELNKSNATDSSETLPLNGRTSSHFHDDVDQHQRPFTVFELDQCFAMLSESMFSFISNFEDNSQWTINRSELNAFLQSKEILRLIGDRLSSPALRILRMCIDHGKLDEKTLQETGLLGAKDLRQTLGELKQMGFVDLQEVPRESQRQPNRTIFLWFHDTERVRKLLLENLFKAMSRMMQRLKVERQKLSFTLEKVARSDVQGSEEKILSTSELKMFKRLLRTEEWLLGEVSRLDDSVAILRDL